VLPTPESFYLVGADALAPIFDSGRRRANADVVAAQRDEAAFSYHMARRGLCTLQTHSISGSV